MRIENATTGASKWVQARKRAAGPPATGIPDFGDYERPLGPGFETITYINIHSHQNGDILGHDCLSCHRPGFSLSLVLPAPFR